MEDQKLQIYEGQVVPSYTLRAFLRVGFRHGRLIALCFVGIFLGVALAVLFLPQQYEARMKILVRHERVNPLVTAEPNAPVPQFAVRTTEEELNSEVELLKGRDLLEKVVVACGLHLPKRPPGWISRFRLSQGGRAEQPQREDSRVAYAVRNLDNKLQVQVLPKTDLIAMSYKSSDPHQAVRVLSTLVNFYLEKHLAIHRPPGAFEFFQQESDRFRTSLATAEARLAEFNRDNGVVSAPVEKANTLQKLSEFEATLRQTQAAIAESEQRIRVLKEEGASTPSRMTTQVRTSANSLLPQVKTTLLNLELKRTELLAKFEPSYRPVQEVEKEIAQTRAAIAEAEKAPLREETTDRDPTYEFLRSELSKEKSQLASLRARAVAISQGVRAYQEKARQLGKQEIAQQDLVRAAKTAEDNYLLYLRKEEEARITDALDRKRILNVAIAEAATVPTLPAQSSRLYVFLMGGLLASVVSVGLAFVVDYLDSSFRTPDEVQRFLNVPVLAAIPQNGGSVHVAGLLRVPGAALRDDS